jgi:hypothetical protein
MAWLKKATSSVSGKGLLIRSSPAPDRSQSYAQGQLLGGFDAFGDHFQVEVVRQVDHGGHQLAVFFALSMPPTKLLSIFSKAIGRLLRCTKEENPVPKSSSENRTPSRPKAHPSSA